MNNDLVVFFMVRFFYFDVIVKCKYKKKLNVWGYNNDYFLKYMYW